MKRLLMCGLGLVVIAICLRVHAAPLAASGSTPLWPAVAIRQVPLPYAAPLQAPAATADHQLAAEAQRPLLKRYCITCHNQALKTAGLMLDQLDVERVGEAVETWEKVA